MVKYGTSSYWPWNRPFQRSQPALALSPSAWVDQNLGFTPDPRQAEFLDLEDPRIVYLTSRQSGKTQTAAAKAVHLAFAFPGSEFLLFGAVAR